MNQVTVNDASSSDKPRGFYKEKEDWSLDKSKDYFEGPMMQIGWPAIKMVSIGLFAILV